MTAAEPARAPWRARPELWLIGIVSSALAVAFAVSAATGATRANDFFTEAAPSYLALSHGHLVEFLQLAPIYGGSLLLRAPFAMAPLVFGGGLRAFYLASALPCMLAAAVFCVWLAAQPGRDGVRPLARGVALTFCCVASPIVVIVLYGGHPEEVLGAVLCVCAVVVAQRGRATLAGVIIGLAIANKPWALVAAPVVIAALPAQRWRAGLVAAATAALVLMPFAVVRDHGVSLSANGADVGHVLFNPTQLLWWLGPSSWLVHEARIGVVLVSVVLAAMWAVVRRKGRIHSHGSDALLLLALVLLLRAAFDPQNNLWYHLPFLFALLAYEVRIGRLPTLVAVSTMLLLVVVPVRGVAMSHDLRAAAYAAFVVPLVIWLVSRVFRPQRTGMPLTRFKQALGTRLSPGRHHMNGFTSKTGGFHTMRTTRFKLLTVLCAAVLCAFAAGCGGASNSQGPPTVHLSVTAPVDGARVNVGNVLVFGTVDPAIAKVRIAGQTARVKNGVFRRWVSLRKGLTQIGISAAAPGYVSATMRVAVHNFPRRYAIPHSPRNPLQDFINRGNQICSRGVVRLQELALKHLDQNLTAAQAVEVSHQIVTIVSPVIPQLRALHAPPKQAAGYAKFVNDLQSIVDRAHSAVSAGTAGNTAGALAAYAGAQATLVTAENEGSALELFTCANNSTGG